MSEHAQPEGDPVAGEGRADDEPPDAGEQELLAAFDRLSPRGSLQWGFDDAIRRIEHPDVESAAGAAPWNGLPDDLWERGRSARIGRRFVGDVAGVLADLLAADARVAADAAVDAVNGDRFVAAFDALRFLAARVERLESRIDPLGLEAAEWPVPVPDPSEWAHIVDTWLGPEDPQAMVVVGESGDGSLLTALGGAGRRIVGVEPRGVSVWRAFDAVEDRGVEGVEIVLAEVVHHLRTVPDRSAAGVVLLGCVDRLDLAGKLELLDQSVRIIRPGGTLVVLPTDQSAWDEALSIPARDLAPGRPLHPETWAMLLRRSGVADAVWHRPVSGTLHAVVARVER
jgi:hypothetical protein